MVKYLDGIHPPVEKLPLSNKNVGLNGVAVDTLGVSNVIGGTDSNGTRPTNGFLFVALCTETIGLGCNDGFTLTIFDAP